MLFITAQLLLYVVHKYPCIDLLWPAQEIVYITGTGDAVISFKKQDTAIDGYLRELTWMYEREELNTSQARYSISDDWLTLTITNPQIYDIGLYSIQYKGLTIPQQNDFCEDTTMSILRDYPILSPAYTLLTVPGIVRSIYIDSVLVHV